MIVPPPEVSSPKYNPKNNVNERVKYNNLFNKFISLTIEDFALIKYI